jgi:hypothetical protein
MKFVIKVAVRKGFPFFLEAVTRQLSANGYLQNICFLRVGMTFGSFSLENQGTIKPPTIL